jgi:hypothetical protein
MKAKPKGEILQGHIEELDYPLWKQTSTILAVSMKAVFTCNRSFID